MTSTDQFMLALQAYQEIQAELRQEEGLGPLVPDGSASAPSSPSQPAGLPAGSVLLGLAEDGLPLLLSLYDPAPGPLLVAGDGGSGKTAFLQSLARLSNAQDPGDIQFGVVTPFPEEWTTLEGAPNSLGVWPAHHPSAQTFLAQLVGWADALPKTRQAVLLLIDGFDLLADMDQYMRRDLRWLFLKGPEHQIWPVVSVNPSRLNHMQHWLEYFHTRVLGKVKHAHAARLLVEDPDVDLAGLLPGVQFGLYQPGQWLKFWLPPLE